MADGHALMGISVEHRAGVLWGYRAICECGKYIGAGWRPAPTKFDADRLHAEHREAVNPSLH